MKFKLYNHISLLNKVSFFQLFIISFIAFFYLLANKYTIFSGLLISGITSSVYLQLIKLSTYCKQLALYGFLIRLTIVALPCAILVHKYHSNLIALFSGLALGQTIYLLFVFLYAKELSRKCL